MKNFKATAAMLGIMGMLAVSETQAVDWVISPDGVDYAFGSSVDITGNGTVNFNYNDTTQPSGIFGAGFVWNSSDGIKVDFDADLYTYDSYNAPGSTPYSGWWDAFIVTISTTDFYWNLAGLSDPITASDSTWVWGGTNYGDGKLESYVTAPYTYDSVSMQGSGPFYVSIVLDTKTSPNLDTLHPSWGTFHVSPVPEPETYAMLLVGLGLLGFTARRRKSSRNFA